MSLPAIIVMFSISAFIGLTAMFSTFEFSWSFSELDPHVFVLGETKKREGECACLHWWDFFENQRDIHSVLLVVEKARVVDYQAADDDPDRDDGSVSCRRDDQRISC